MLFGVREICDVVLRAKKKMKLGNIIVDKDMPVLYFDSLKTSSLEGAATTVYAQGGKGNSRLVAWEGERTITFTMEDALISPIGFSILSGAGLVEKSGSAGEAITHATERAVIYNAGTEDKPILAFGLEHTPYAKADEDFYLYVIPLDGHGDFDGQPIRFDSVTLTSGAADSRYDNKVEVLPTDVEVEDATDTELTGVLATALGNVEVGDLILVDYYYKSKKDITEIEIDAENFAGNFYLEASTLFRNKDGFDMPAEFVIPNCKIQSNFTFTMAATGDPSTFTFTMDAFPDYTKFNRTKKVLAAIQVMADPTVLDAKLGALKANIPADPAENDEGKAEERLNAKGGVKIPFTTSSLDD